MKIKAVGDRLNITFGANVITDVKAHVEYFSSLGQYVQIDSQDWTVEENGTKCYASTQDGGKFTLEFFDGKYGLEIKQTFVAGENQTIKQALRMRVQGRLAVRPKDVVYNDYDYWFCGNRCCLFMNSYAETTSMVKDQHVFASEYAAFRSANKKFGVIGALTFEKYFTTVRVWENGHFDVTANMNEHWHTFDCFNIEPGQEVVSDKYLIAFNDTDALNVLGKAIAYENGVDRLKEVPTGYNDGYYFGMDISEELILRELEVVKEKKLPIKYFILDWGWFDRYGDWEANEKFPHGMKYIADKIYEAGFLPGIWIAPFNFDKDCKPVQEHPDWFVKNANYAGGKDKYIDLSVDGACEWLHNLYKKVSVEWGYRYIKFDYIVMHFALGGFSDKSFTGLKNYRKAIEIMRNAVTEDTMLMSCTAPMSPSVKFADSTRTGHDVYDNWLSLKFTAMQTLKRLHMGEYIILDPDCMLARTSDCEDSECALPTCRTQTEMDTFVTFQSVTGGAIIISDKLSILDEKALKRIKALLPANKKPATALDLYDRAVPSVFKYNQDSEFTMYALINWEDYDADFTLEVGQKLFGKEFFSGEELARAKKFSFTLKPHQSKILYFAKDKASFAKLGESIMPE